MAPDGPLTAGAGTTSSPSSRATRITPRRERGLTVPAANGGSTPLACAGDPRRLRRCGLPRAAIPRRRLQRAATTQGSSYFQVNQKNGRRWSAARASVAGRRSPEPDGDHRRSPTARPFEGDARVAWREGRPRAFASALRRGDPRRWRGSPAADPRALRHRRPCPSRRTRRGDGGLSPAS